MTRIDYIMDKLYEIDKELGGNSKSMINYNLSVYTKLFLINK